MAYKCPPLIMKKIVSILMIMFACNMFCYSQTSTSYVGKGKLYQLQDFDTGTFVYCANYTYTNETLYGEHITSNNICVYQHPNTHNYSSSYGNYVEVQHSQCLTGSHLYSFSKGMLFYASGYGICAFTIRNNQLCLIKFYEDTLISVLDNNFSEGSDFSIYVVDNNTTYGSRQIQPSFYILNNGYLKYYESISSSVSSISAVRMEKTNGRKYNISGVEVDNPRNEIYIQDGKKIIKK